VTSDRDRPASWRTKKGSVPLRYWILWWFCLVFALFLFYVLFAPFWFALRVAAWLAEFRARRRRLTGAGT